MPRIARLAVPARVLVLVLVLAVQALAASAALAQSSPAFGPLASPAAAAPGDDMPLADYLGLLRQIAPAAEQGARTYLAAMQLRCGRAPTTAELRQAMSEGDGHPALMALIRAAHLQDTAARDRMIAQIPCPRGGAR
ncbi:hypothetical protein DelCs14_1688 [Delftia sp. Cs1-4]|uniref:hypothetical protein n=1 Tax=Delftia sp. (strain Cs1-4) TaxID=742013 RepID=UPI00020E7A69|nr:hypothetical protein [Delftia sp. Cs1-4]AEF88717.1 hypothetical protein DelCs14_1688 [Delftia sp. Cs1-4]